MILTYVRRYFTRFSPDSYSSKIQNWRPRLSGPHPTSSLSCLWVISSSRCLMLLIPTLNQKICTSLSLILFLRIKLFYPFLAPHHNIGTVLRRPHHGPTDLYWAKWSPIQLASIFSSMWMCSSRLWGHDKVFNFAAQICKFDPFFNPFFGLKYG